MAGYRTDLDRRIVPRWRRFEDSLSRGELDPPTPARDPARPWRDPLARKTADWMLHRTVAHAADLVGAALVLGRYKDAEDPAQFLLREPYGVSRWAKELAQWIVDSGSDEELALPTQIAREMLHEQIHRLRRHVRKEPRDSVRWVDLALAYATLGLEVKAAENMNVAVHLASDNRFVLRSASRLFVHLKKPDRAHRVLLNSVRTQYDPWLLAAEIAVSSIAATSPQFVKHARTVIADASFAPSHISELAAATGTAELEAGNTRKAKKLFRLSLEEPTENSVAQVSWACRQHRVVVYGDTMPTAPGAFEAESWRLYAKSQWREALRQCRLWQFDQPFSSRPGCHGSFIACVAMRDYRAGERFAKEGLIANKDDFTLSNNLAFSLINQDRLPEAEGILRSLSSTALSDRESVVLEATGGLLDYRNRNYESGRQKYMHAIQRAETKGWNTLSALASAFHAIEETAARQPGHETDVKEVIAMMQNQEDPIFGVLGEQLATLAPHGARD